MVSGLPFHGTLRWLPPEDGGLRSPFPSDHWCRPAWIEPGDLRLTASLVIENIVPNERVSSNVTAWWLAWENLSEEEWTVRPGDVLAVTEGPKVVAYLTVEAVD